MPIDPSDLRARSPTSAGRPPRGEPTLASGLVGQRSEPSQERERFGSPSGVWSGAAGRGSPSPPRGAYRGAGGGRGAGFRAVAAHGPSGPDDRDKSFPWCTGLDRAPNEALDPDLTAGSAQGRHNGDGPSQGVDPLWLEGWQSRACLARLPPPALGSWRPGLPRGIPAGLPGFDEIAAALSACLDGEGPGLVELPGLDDRTAEAAELFALHLSEQRMAAWTLDAIERQIGGVVATLEAKRDRSLVALGRRYAAPFEQPGTDPDLTDPCQHPGKVPALCLRWEWWQRRIAALGELGHKVRACSQLTRVLECQEDACGHRWHVPKFCDEPLLCPDCRDRRTARESARIEAEIDAALAAMPDRATWRLRHVTVTVPGAGTTEARMSVAQRARAKFCHRIGRYLEAQGIKRHAGSREVAGWAWWASLEATEGSDDLGHFHWHIMAVSPFLPAPLLASEWGRALELAGADPMRRSLSAALAALAKCAPRFPGAPAAARLVELARVPWHVTGERPPRRGRGEAAIDYAERRATWAQRFAVGAALAGIGRPEPAARVRSATIGQIAGRVRGLAAEIERDRWIVSRVFGSLAWLPWAIVDVRLVRGDVKAATRELVKYTLKGWSAGSELIARILCESKRRQLRWLCSSLPAADPEPAEGGCPKCGSPRVRPERLDDPEAFSERWEQISRAIRRERERAPP